MATDSYATLMQKQAQLERALGLPQTAGNQLQLAMAQDQLKQAQLAYGKDVLASNDYSTPQASAAAQAVQAMQAADAAKKAAEQKTITYTPQSNIAQYVNPNAGKLLGYVYDNRDSRERWSDTKTITIEGGEGSRQETEYAQPDITTKKYYSDSKAIPIYEPPLQFVWNGKPLTDEQKFNLTAKLAGAGDVESPGKVSGGPGGGTIDSPYVPLEMRQAIGLPRSFDMLTNIDPSKPDWNLQQSRIYNPTSHGFFGDFFADFGMPLQIAMMAAGVPPVYSGVITGAASAAAAGGNILEGALKGAATGAAASGLASLGNAVAGSSGVAGLLQNISDATGIPTAVFENAAKGAATTAIKGGDPLQGALAGAATAGVGGALQEIPGFTDLDPALQKALGSAAMGATKAAVTGGDPFQAGLQGGLSGLASAIGKMPNEYATATEDWIDKGGLGSAADYQQNALFDMLSQQAPLSEEGTDLTTELPEQTRAEYEPQESSALDELLATPTESWIDQARLVSDPLALEVLGTGAEESPIEYATPTESWIDQYGLGQPLTPADYATPTEDYIDRGGLGGGTPTSPPPSTTTGGRPSTTPAPAPAPTPAPAPAPTPAPPSAATQSGGSPGNLLALLGLMGQQQAPAAPQEVPPAEISRFYDIGTGKYVSGISTPYAAGGSAQDLMNILRG